MGRGHGIIVGRRCPKIQNCPTCGQMRVWHKEGYYKCPVPAEVIDALRAYRRANGKAWKKKLCDEWTAGHDLGERLQQARNMIGPRRLYNIKLDEGR